MKKIRFILLLALVAGSLPGAVALAQTFEWVKPQVVDYRLNPQMVRYTVATDTAGNVLQAGLLNYKASTAPGMAGEVLLRKYSRAGNLIFQHTLTGNSVIRHLVSYPNGDFLLAGAFRDSVVLSPGHKLAGNSTAQYFIARYSYAGQVLWLRNLSATVTGMQEITAVTVYKHG
ncbi:MAG TPA: hypothetical protein VK927_01455, partial [Adhaeribacter sp.]|nr:hypothetical protein [Adhaeribacter sp.]